MSEGRGSFQLLNSDAEYTEIRALILLDGADGEVEFERDILRGLLGLYREPRLGCNVVGKNIFYQSFMNDEKVIAGDAVTAMMCQAVS
ncbi:hypothetical protein PsalMR5_02248 [Piscirickettsia salmonis]|uniref:hypothetical protein n=1 Tax=Piscirickettsia salmonis TaxID=1238 RepID=UPI0012BAA8FB|nr:hypothetical protein [Piscirickettsia salmonis]QGP54428.1 hypothetical protein PsalSR1_01865 [Piscirickettsia salmonis]QGP59688.1 hypothetical protein PsalBI1_02280 [Piscirickettsia salmonis]QGP64378.1 hypothetical protein PsalMR5_02248 [Piscirickettsia salmonis]